MNNTQSKRKNKKGARFFETQCSGVCSDFGAIGGSTVAYCCIISVLLFAWVQGSLFTWCQRAAVR